MYFFCRIIAVISSNRSESAQQPAQHPYFEIYKLNRYIISHLLLLKDIDFVFIFRKGFQGVMNKIKLMFLNTEREL